MTKRRDVVRLLEKNGFANKGGMNHDKYVHPDGRWTEVPRHSEVDKWTFGKIKKQAGLE
jgi:predicted RNA binding protein YcfA (HicA-like mRNA interferase family)